MIETDRLTLRPWRESDIDEFMRVTNTPAVMEFLGGLQPRETFEGAFARSTASQAANGHCFWIVERRSDQAVLGFCGLKIGDVGTIVGEIEIGWRLREDAWGKGYAREAADACIAWAWANLPVNRVIAITVRGNQRSWGLMERLGLSARPDLDFGHPSFAEEHPLHHHIVYEIVRPASA